MPLPTPDAHENLSDDLLLEWYDQGTIASLTLDSVTQVNIDLFMETVLRIESQWENPPQRIIINLQNPHIGLTPYFRQKLEILTQHFNTTQGRYAFIMSKSILTQSMQFLLVDIIKQQGSQARVDIYFSSDKAYEWLMQAE